MQKLLEMLSNGQALSVEELSIGLGTNFEDVKRQIEFLEHAGYIREVNLCNHECKGCAMHCGSSKGLTRYPIFWEVIK